ncbi:hypothetical protein COJ96_15690 [Bacillus sp. AFS073361]|uniref:hypothetical protein n=1 Tax=Bacillus sp. AFS073361 TaxID=2033511 RepID=UPI000BF4541A|nr:hypothetical protein [Bacillus sp. AFS073361]PFP27657.1 hypothetical protein COJ96_15690 [Bacillus sp. AFS073361]
MEETLNNILLELQGLKNGQQELIEVQKELISRTESLEKGQKKLITCSKNLKKSHEESITGQHQLKIQIENFEQVKDLLSLGQNEIKELIKQTTVYMAGKMSFSEKIIMEIELLNERERQEVLNKINGKTFIRTNQTWAENWDDDDY